MQWLGMDTAMTKQTILIATLMPATVVAIASTHISAPSVNVGEAKLDIFLMHLLVMGSVMTKQTMLNATMMVVTVVNVSLMQSIALIVFAITRRPVLLESIL